MWVSQSTGFCLLAQYFSVHVLNTCCQEGGEKQGDKSRHKEVHEQPPMVIWHASSSAGWEVHSLQGPVLLNSPLHLPGTMLCQCQAV